MAEDVRGGLDGVNCPSETPMPVEMLLDLIVYQKQEIAELRALLALCQDGVGGVCGACACVGDTEESGAPGPVVTPVVISVVMSAEGEGGRS